MKRLIIDAKKMTPEILSLVKEKYPEGYFEDDIVVFKNHLNETIEAIQVEAQDAIYLIKIGKYLNIELENFEMDLDVDPKLKPKEIDEETSDDDDKEEPDDIPEDDDEDDEDEISDEDIDQDDEDEDKI